MVYYAAVYATAADVRCDHEHYRRVFRGRSDHSLGSYPTQDYVAHTLLLHIQDYGGSRMEMGYACALTVVLFLLMVFGNKLVQKVINKVGD